MADLSNVLVLVLPEDPARQEQLRKKLSEYEQRYDTCVAPERKRSALCKKTILKELLEHGKVNYVQLFEKMRDYDDMDPGPFVKAFSVIEDYCLTGGSLPR